MTARQRRRRFAWAFWILTGTIVAAVMALFVFPTAPYVDQRHQLSAASQRIQVLNTQNAALSERITKLQTDSEIERIAREKYHLVRPGERAFAMLPLPNPTTTIASRPVPVAHASTPHRGLLQSAWHRLANSL